MEILLEDLVNNLITLAIYILIIMLPALMLSRLHPTLFVFGIAVGLVIVSMITSFALILWIAVGLGLVALMRISKAETETE